MIRIVLTVLGSILFIYVLLIAMMYFMQRNMMYIPSPAKPSLQQAGIAGLREITVNTPDGLSLYSWYKPASSPENPTIVWFHGNASNVYITAMRTRPYMENGYGLLAVEYRGYSGNPGSPTEQGLYADARAHIAWLMQNGVPENNIVVYGESIGTGPAVQMAVEFPALRAVVLESPFTSTIDAAAFHYPFAPVKWLIKDRYENLSKIQNVKSPIVIVYGDLDGVIPHSMGAKLFKEAPEPKSLIVIPGGGHNNLDQFGVSEKVMSLLSE